MSVQNSKYKYLNTLDSPKELRKLPVEALSEVCSEVRDFMIDTITKTGGHFGAGLGVVELTVALHYILNTPEDKILFDVGHQGYPHKILTGRRDLLQTIRQKGGLSGFLKRSESEYDCFGAGHASTSISAGLGLATARDMQNKDYRVVSVIGDGAMTGGLAFEAMNNCGVQKRDILVIMNDNNMSIDPNVSAFSNYFNQLFASSTFQSFRDNVWKLTGKMDELGDRLRKYAARFEDGVKAIITPGVLFEALGFKYFGPVNGHNVTKLVRLLKQIRDVKGPVFLHVITQKGKGYAPAEKDSHYLHAIGKIDRETGKSLKKSTGPKQEKYSDVFGHAMVELCKMNNKVAAVSAAMIEGTGLNILCEAAPEKVIDVGIAEGHAVTFAAGMAAEGMIPVVAIYSTFLQRAYDHIIHDVAIQKLHVIFALDRGGVVGADGPTHHGTFDLAYLRHIPNMIVLAPKDEQELRDLLYSAAFKYTNGPVAIRYPRGEGMGVKSTPMKFIELGTWDMLTKGEDVAILSVGKTVVEAINAAEILKEKGINPTIVNARFIKPLDHEMLKDICENHKHIITVEDGQIQGGFGSAVAEYLVTENIQNVTLKIHGIPDKFVEHGTQEQLYESLGLDASGIANLTEGIINFKKI